MNKGITFLILGVLLCAMGIVFFFHMRQAGNTRTASTASSTVQQSAIGSTAQHSLPTPPTASAPIVSNPTRTESHINPAATPQPVAVSTSGAVSAVNGTSETSGTTGTLSSAPAQHATATPSTAEPSTPASLPLAPPKAADPRASAVPKELEYPLSMPTEKPAPAPVKPQSVPPPVAPVAAKPTAPAAQPTPPTVKPPAPVAPAPAAPAPAAMAKPTPTTSGKHTVKNVGLHFSGSSMLLRIETDSATTFKAFSLTEPDRFVVDLPGTWDGIHAPSVPQNHIVKNARVGMQPTGPRLVLDLERAAKATITKQGGNVIEIQLQ